MHIIILKAFVRKAALRRISDLSSHFLLDSRLIVGYIIKLSKYIEIKTRLLKRTIR
jgi:hypothetical protein